MKRYNFFNVKGDMVVWMIFLTLCMISVMEVYSASSSMTYHSGQFWWPVVQHGSFVLVGVCLAWIIHRMPCRVFKLACALFLIVSYFLLAYVLFAGKINDAARWIKIGSITMQPSELAKISLVGFTAFIAASARENGHISKLGMRIICTAAGAAILLIVFENWSTAGLIAIVIFFMLCYAKAPNKFLAWGGGLGIAAVASMIILANTLSNEQLAQMKDHPVLHRIPTAVSRIKGPDFPDDPAKVDLTKDVQVMHAYIAVATSNGVGKGPGNSVQRDYLPQAFSDFIYAIIIEEWGIFGAVFVMFLYLLLMWRAMRIAKRCNSLFPAYLVMGLALMMVVQAMMNMGVAVGAVPVTGQPLPLISKGGTSTFINCTYIGMILSVSWSAKKRDEAVAPALATNEIPAEVAEEVNTDNI